MVSSSRGADRRRRRTLAEKGKAFRPSVRRRPRESFNDVCPRFETHVSLPGDVPLRRASFSAVFPAALDRYRRVRRCVLFGKFSFGFVLPVESLYGFFRPFYFTFEIPFVRRCRRRNIEDLLQTSRNARMIAVIDTSFRLAVVENQWYRPAFDE